MTCENISQISISLTYAVGGKLSRKTTSESLFIVVSWNFPNQRPETLINNVVRTSNAVRLTVTTASKKNGLK